MNNTLLMILTLYVSAVLFIVIAIWRKLNEVLAELVSISTELRMQNIKGRDQ